MKVVDSLGLAPHHRVEAKRFIKFATVGVAGAVTHFSIVNILVQLVGISEQAANPFGFIAAVLQNFLLNRRWTFPESRQRNVGLQLVQFAIVSVVGLVVNQFVFTTVHKLLEQTWIQLVGQQRLGHALSYNFALAVAIGVVLFWNFAINRLWTYRGLSKLSSEPST